MPRETNLISLGVGSKVISTDIATRNQFYDLDVSREEVGPCVLTRHKGIVYLGLDAGTGA